MEHVNECIVAFLATEKGLVNLTLSWLCINIKVVLQTEFIPGKTSKAVLVSRSKRKECRNFPDNE